MPDPTQTEGQAPATIRFGEFELDFARRELRRAGQLVGIQPTPLRVLLFLAEHRERTVPRQVLLDAIWPGISVSDESITRALKEARRAVGDDGEAQSVLLTQRGLGYRFIAPLADQVGQGEAAEDASLIQPRRRPEAARPGARNIGLSRRWLALAAGALAIALSAAAAFVLRERTSPPTPIRSIAVLPLENLSEDPAQEYFADGMTDLLITDLSKLPGVRVASRTSVMQFKGVKAPLTKIADDLGVDAILEGTVAREAGRVRITAQLIDARNESHLWAESYERDLAHALEIQREVARAVADRIQVVLTPELAQRLERPKPVDPRALDAYVRGYALYASLRSGFGSADAAIGSLEEAIRLEPDWAEPYGLLSTIQTIVASYWPTGRQETSLRAAREAARRAEELDPRSGAAAAARGLLAFYYDWDWAAAEADLRRAIELGFLPAQSKAYLGQVLLAIGRTENALALTEQATSEDPLNVGVRGYLAYSLFLAGKYEQAIHQTQHILAVNPDVDWAYFVERESYVALGRGEEAAQVYRRQARVNPMIVDRERMEKEFRAGGISGIHRLYLGFWQEDGFLVFAAVNATALREKDLAFELLERAYRGRDAGMRWLVADRRLAPLYSDPRFADLARRMNLPMPASN